MSATKKCKNCGADNDPLMSVCIFCKSPLAEVDVNSISNEDLILNAGEWIGKVGSDFEHMTEKFNAWTGKGMIKISANQLEGLAQKYLSLLQIRSLNNPNLQLAYSDLKKEFDNKRSGFFYKLGITNPGMRIFVIYISLIAIVLILLALLDVI